MISTILTFIIFVLLSLNTFANHIEITPIKINFKGIETKGDSIAVYGDFGSMFLSADNAQTWDQIKVFDGGTIVKVFFEDFGLVAVNDDGQINVSENNGKSWEEKINLEDSIYAAVKYPDGFFIRSQNKFLTLSNELKITNEFDYFSQTLSSTYVWQYNYSILCFDDYLVAELDSSLLVRYDFNLNPIDTLNFYNLGLSDNYIHRHVIQTDSNFIYTKIDNTIYKINNFTEIEKVYNDPQLIPTINYKALNGNVYIIEYNRYNRPFHCRYFKVINPDSTETITAFDSKYLTHTYVLNDFLIKGHNVLMAGDGKLLLSINQKDSSLNVISDICGLTILSCPDKLNDSTFLFYSGYYTGTYNSYIYMTKNSGLTFKSQIEFEKNKELSTYTFYFKYFDTDENRIYFGGVAKWESDGGVYYTDDYGKNFIYKETPDFYYNKIFPDNNYKKIKQLPNIQKNGNRLITASNAIYSSLDQSYSEIYTYDKEFNLISIHKDSSMIIDYLFDSKDTNSFTLHCLNMKDKTYDIRSTTNKGAQWNIIKKYDYADSLVYLKEMKVKDRDLVVFVYFNMSDSINSFEVYDKETGEINTIYQYKLSELGYEVTSFNGIDSDNGTTFIAVNDTLFYTDDLYDRSKWEYTLFPNNGKVIRTYKVFDGLLYARYSDDKRAQNAYWLRIIEDTVKPEASIAAEDHDFGKRDINQEEYLPKVFEIKNNSEEAVLIIKGYSGPSDNAFITNLPEINENSTIEIQPGTSYEFEVNFIPEEEMMFEDSIIFISNAIGLDSVAYLSGEGIDTTLSVVETEVETKTYLYGYPPYPVPAKNRVSAKIYWDPRLDIDNAEIMIVNSFGTKIAGKENIEIIKYSDYNGQLVWNCSGVSSGAYFVYIKHGSGTWTLKVILQR